MPFRVGICVVVATLLLSTDVAAQSWSFDARKIALGGSRGSNLATEMVEAEQTYDAIVLPFGLFQVFSDVNIYDPASDDFDLVRAIEYAASPLHFVIGRGSESGGQALESDIPRATLSRDLNQYRGLDPPNRLSVRESISPTWGRTFKFRERTNGTFHGIRVGAGPYLALRGIATIDERLTDLLASETDVFVPNTQFFLTNFSQGQMAVAVTSGYRGRMAWPAGIGGGSVREGLYVASDFHYIQGFRYEAADVNVRLDTDETGLITEMPPTPPMTIDHVTATRGQGMAVDVGINAVVSRWALGFGVNELGNRITWKRVDQTRYSRPDLTSGDAEFLESPTTRIANVRVELPTDYRGTVEYDAPAWSALGEVGHSGSTTSFHFGFERRYQRIELRGGVRQSNGNWTPTGGFGVHVRPRVVLDVAVFGATSVIERRQQVAIAASIRLNRAK